ncbi:MAG: hypothetical protein WCE68_07390 [Anaerolineales bacterium]
MSLGLPGQKSAWQALVDEIGAQQAVMIYAHLDLLALRMCIMLGN